jgi:acyl-CoA synthetase (AMP-forming)/AMP-acid ligase II
MVLAGVAHAARPAVTTGTTPVLRHGTLLIRALDIALRLNGPLDRPIVLCFPKGPDLVTHMAGVLLGGGSFLAIHPAHLDARWGGFFEEAELRLLIHGGRRPAGIEAVPGLEVQRAWTWRSGLSHRDLRMAPASRSGIAVVSSGTTGQPHGRWRPSRSLLHATMAAVEAGAISWRSRLSWVNRTELAASNTHLLATLVTGACLCPFDPVPEGLAAMTRWLADQHITHLHCTPSLLRAWLESLTSTSAFPNLTVVKAGGEAARAADFLTIREKLGRRVRFLNGLGVSEAVGNIACGEIFEGDAAAHDLLPVGKPVKGRRIRVVGPEGEDVAVGGRGEIVVEDEWISPGFGPPWPLPLPSRTARRVVRTGDAGCWDDKGRLFHLGRMDRCLRIRGSSVDLADIEARVAALAHVRNVAAIAEPDGGADTYRLAIVLDTDSSDDRQHVISLMGTCLPELPARIAFFKGFPLAHGGKRDDAAILDRWPTTSAPFEGTENKVREAWIEALGHADFGPNDPFVSVGGDSLAAMRLVNALTAQGVSLGALARFNTVASMAEAIETGSLEIPPSAPARFQWVSLRGSQAGHAIAFSPGGAFSEPELWMAGSLFHAVAPSRLLLVARFGGDGTSSLSSLDLGVLAAGLLPVLLGLDRPILVGLCTGAMLTLHLARELEKAGRPCARAILLDPWTPGLPANPQPQQWPESLAPLQALLKTPEVPRVSCPVDAILARDDPRAAHRLAFWSSRGDDCLRIHMAAGDHISFVRSQRTETHRMLDGLCAAPHIPPERANGHRSRHMQNQPVSPRA